ncbi:MAG: hypothetical protein HKN72_03055 [Gemmatimonadetes bacterium]|nr:hypothetical protein [Gemmatimonadota bacterium]NNF12173.1 hypothetical protein [Gemmatimonadota bacterium]
MKSTRGWTGAALAQILAQALTSWALLAHVTDWENVSPFVAVPLLAAIAVPFRHDGGARDRAMANFGAAVVASGILWWEILLGALDGLTGGPGSALGPISLLLLVATVLFALAGGLFWLRREEHP